MQVIRLFSICLFWPLMARTGHGFRPPDAIVTVWSGIRGIVGIVLALLVLNDSAITDEAFKQRCFFLMATTVVLTVVIQGSTYSLVLKVKAVEACSARAGWQRSRTRWVTACLQALKWDERAPEKYNNNLGQHDQEAVPPLSVLPPSPQASAAERQDEDPQHPNDAEASPVSSAWPGN